MTGNYADDKENEEPGQVPTGAGCAGRTTRRVTKERRCTVKAKKSHGGGKSYVDRTKPAKTGKPTGRNVTYGVREAARILKEWGYIVGIVAEADVPFNLIAHKGREVLSILVIRPREPVMNAAGVRAYHSREVLALQPYWNSDADNIQFWLFSRVAGLLRYRVFRGGIWNVGTMQNGWQKKREEMADCKTGCAGNAVQKSRTAPLPVHATGLG
ncbi:MAG: hypothetical protein M0R30_12410 [Methanoregula sp.]|uniref:hypothetical protein n=1 Tax=Methanoregula sp. TaxID=2052170 RepID=UPI0025D502B9|nr:hypothetical protein [Methanoregula sp.]MCK9632427.1 hypothetical protein [Methanoregula sp.]